MRNLMIFCLMSLMVTYAQAAIVSVTNVIDAGQAPDNLDLDVEENILPQVFEEQQCVELGDDLTVDIDSPGNYTFPGPTDPAIYPTLSAGTIVNSYLIHYDPLIEYPAQAVEVTGCSITFDTPILGLIFQSGRLGPDTLGASDSIVGSSSVYWTTGSYPYDVRGFDLWAGYNQDPITLSADRLTVSFDTKANTIDEMRVITEPMWVGATAWAAGERYVERGNWATYTPYPTDTSITLYAGRNMEAGLVEFSEPYGGDGDDFVDITITLNTGWRFADKVENVKVQDYDTAPSGKPNPGLFDWKEDADPDEDTFTITVPLNAYYGVQVDVERPDCG
jgi:hypothetical protein